MARRTVRGLSFTALAIALLALVPAIRTDRTALAVLADAIGIPVLRPFAPPVARLDASVGGVAGDLYYPGRPAPGVLLVPGAAERGTDDPRVVRTARAIARADRAVFVPELALASRRLAEDDLERIVRAAVALARHPLARGRVALLGFSFGGSYALVAASDPRLRQRLAIVAVFGAYFDLVGVIQAVTGGVSIVDGRRFAFRPHPLAQGILRRVALLLAPAAEREALRAALEGGTGPEPLGPGSRAVYELVRNRDPERTFRLAEGLAPDARAVLERFSPAASASSLDAPVVAIHSLDDPAVPYGEAIRLARALPEARLLTVSRFRHVDLDASPAGWIRVTADLRSAWRFASSLLAAQE